MTKPDREFLIEELAGAIFQTSVGYENATKLYYHKPHYEEIAEAALKVVLEHIEDLTRYDMVTRNTGLLSSRNIVSKKSNGNYLSYHQLKNLLENPNA